LLCLTLEHTCAGLLAAALPLMSTIRMLCMRVGMATAWQAPVARRPTARACAQASCEGREWRLDRLSAVCGFFRARARCRCAAPAPTLADAVGQKLWSREAIRSACSFKLCALVRCAATAGAAPPCGAGCKAPQPARASSTGAARPTAACFAARLRDPAHRSLT